MNNYSVYKHICPNRKIYIGITLKKPEYRWNNGKGYKSNKYFYNAIQKYGWENIEHKILYINLSKEEAEQKEIELIKKYNSANRKYGYNISKGGNCRGKVSNETKNKLSNISKKLWQDEKYRKKQEQKTPGMLGKHHSKETIKKMQEIAKKREISEEQKEKLRKMRIGTKMSEEAKEKIRKAMTGRKMSEETKRKLSKQKKGKSTWIKGRKLSDEHKKNISKSLCKKVLCIETGEIFNSIKEAEKELKINNISNVCNNKAKSSKGYHFKFVK